MTAADELSSSVSEDTGFSSAPPLPPDPLELCDLPDPQDPQETLDPPPDHPPPPATDTPPGSLCEEESQTVLDLCLPAPPETKLDPYPDSACDSVWEDDLTQALKELDDRCEEEEADFSSMSR